MAKHIVILGAGLGGLCAAIKLEEAGHTVELIEKHPRVGGTWHQNRYPGCACDVPVALYQFSFAQSLNWSRLFPQAPEIQAYAEELVERYALAPHIRLNDEAVSARFDEAEARWHVETASGYKTSGDVLIGALGQLNRPFTPDIEGLDSFAGERAHSADWPDDLSMEGKRVGVIGSAASAVQIIPEAAEAASHLTVFQRTANYVIPRNDRAVPPEEIALMMSRPEAAVDLNDRQRQLMYDNAEDFFWQAFAWTPEGRAAYTRQARDHLEAQVSDPGLREKLWPDYPIGCKRVLISDDYLSTMERDDVSLVTDPITRVEPDGVRAGGALHELDVLVLATGFETTGWRWSVDVEGPGGHLSEVWGEAPEAYLGCMVSGFPNLFILYGPNTNLGHNSITFMLEQQVAFAARAIALAEASGAKAIAPTREAQARFNEAVQAQLANTAWADPGCNSWYKTEGGLITQNWGGDTRSYAKAVAEPVPEDFVLG